MSFSLTQIKLIEQYMGKISLNDLTLVLGYAKGSAGWVKHKIVKSGVTYKKTFLRKKKDRTLTEDQLLIVKKNVGKVSLDCIKKKLGFKSGSNRWLKKYLLDRGLYIDYEANRINHEYFEYIDTEDKAYIYGFIVGDGCVRRDCGGRMTLSIKISTIDRDLIFSIKSRLGVAGNNTYEYLTPEGRRMIALIVSSRRLVSSLIDKGVVPRKSFSDISNIYFPEGELLWHFLRGLIDSDGCIGHRTGKKSVLGIISFMQGKYNKNLVKRVRRTINLELNTTGSFCERPSGVTVIYSGLDVKRILERLYPADRDVLCLKRKKMKALHILNTQVFCRDNDYAYHTYLEMRRKGKSIKEIVEVLNMSENSLWYAVRRGKRDKKL